MKHDDAPKPAIGVLLNDIEPTITVLPSLFTMSHE
jgi:hypothetical protein